eukprot:3175093-Alexandrium_andersonii.AAC.1
MGPLGPQGCKAGRPRGCPPTEWPALGASDRVPRGSPRGREAARPAVRRAACQRSGLPWGPAAGQPPGCI